MENHTTASADALSQSCISCWAKESASVDRAIRQKLMKPLQLRLLLAPESATYAAAHSHTFPATSPPQLQFLIAVIHARAPLLL